MTGTPDTFRLAGSVLDGKYRVDRVVAEGGFGIVYAGHHLRLDVPLAIKVLKPNRLLSVEARAEVVARFLVEARTTARLAHPNIARAMDTGVLHTDDHPEGLPWLVLEWLDGRTLEDELEERRGRGGRTPKETFELLGPVIDAIAYAHSEGVVHRDLKPSNVMLVRGRGKVVPRVLDFGIAKLAEGEFATPSGHTTTESSLVAFSPGYAAPEQVSRARTGPWTDVHALGLMLTEMLSDESAYALGEGIQVLSSILSSERPTPERRGRIVGPWEEVIRRAVAVNPGDRQADAGELLRELTSTLDVAEASTRSVPRPIPLVRAAAGNVNPTRAAPASVQAVSAPHGSTTQPGSTAVVSELPARRSKPSTMTIAVGLALTGVLVGVLVLAFGSSRGSSGAASGSTPPASNDAPSAEPTEKAEPAVPRARGEASPGVGSAWAAPVDAGIHVRPAAPEALAPGVVEPAPKPTTASSARAPVKLGAAKPAQAKPAPPTQNKRVAPTSTFE